jgi:hypothetical protein
MEQRWKHNYRPLTERKQSVQDTARAILTLLANSPERLTAQHLWQQTRFGELRTRSYLSLLEGEGLVDKIQGAARRHPCRRRICGCQGWGITQLGREWLPQE